MKVIKCIIADDEPLGSGLIKKLILMYEGFEVIAVAQNGFEAVKLVNELKPELLFLDISMPKLNGFEVLELLDHLPEVVFVTAHDNFAIKAFEQNAFDYLLKPVSDERFDKLVQKIRLKLSEPAHNKNSSGTLLNKSEPITRIAVKDKNNILIIPVGDLIYVEAADDYIYLRTKGGKFIKKGKISYYSENLNGKEFIQIHRSYIVNLEFITGLELFEKDKYRIKLSTGEFLPVSRSLYKELKEFLNL
ncbi:MAG: LytTR family transcriptional regulator DNA-binding domain-containing protein [Ignavibacteriaceae bacterium]|nr:LytTR family transcriptional regulator DNA-binding domain-containing protein [Ignavibacteriaceae bacterium]